jgi:protein TonB
MTSGRAPSVAGRWTESARWGVCFTLALCFHVAGAVALVAKWSESSDLAANAPVIMIDLAPVAAAPEVVPNDMPPDQVAARQEEPEPEPEPPKPIEKIELPPPEVKAEVTLPPPPPKVVEKPKEKKPDKKKSVARAPSAAPQRSDHAAAPLPGASSRNSNAVPNWRSQLVARLERYKRYPSDARGDNGTTQVAFRVDRSGGVHNARIARSSGSSVLDRETLALLERAQPMPAPPPEASEADLSVVAPVRYNMR